jgi:hypothetical protein
VRLNSNPSATKTTKKNPTSRLEMLLSGRVFAVHETLSLIPAPQNINHKVKTRELLEMNRHRKMDKAYKQFAGKETKKAFEHKKRCSESLVEKLNIKTVRYLFTSTRL